ncbi:MAG: hypothetical protein Q8P46_13660 [Hyphomicrobiales bacterium]|nr:hypothetical protein [Hyphomicrobiales bacterium]
MLRLVIRTFALALLATALIALIAALLLPLRPVPASAGEERQAAGKNEHPDGCWAGGAWYPEGAIIDLKTLTGVQSLSVTPVIFSCKNGVWVSVSAKN